MLGKKSADKEKAIVPNIFIGGILSNVSVLKVPLMRMSSTYPLKTCI